MKTIAVIPAYNEETKIGGVVSATLPFVSEVIVVDDGSSDNTETIARASGARVVRHIVNRGLGGALGTGIRVATDSGDIVVTLDADGQHDSTEIPNLIAPIEQGFADVVLGSRMLNPLGMPYSRQIAQHIGNIVTLIACGAWVSDSQSGFRAFSSDAAKRLNIISNRMEVSSEIVGAIHREGLRLAEVPIRVIYTDYSLAKGQSFKVGLKTMYKLFLRRLGK